MSDPYYSDELVALYHGSARDLTAWLEADVLVTDPPFGVGMGNGDKRGPSPKSGRHGLAKVPYSAFDDTYENFCEVVAPAIADAVAATRRGAVFSGPHLQELPKAAAIGGIFCPVGSGRHSWGFKTFLPVLFYGTDPLLHKGARPNVIQSSAQAEKNGHPCPKPIEWLRWLVNRVALPGEVIVDPFAGSGTTLVAAKESGFRAIGVELEERYCEIAARRLAQDTLFGASA